MAYLDEEDLYQGAGVYWLSPLRGLLPATPFTIERLNQGIQEGITPAFARTQDGGEKAYILLGALSAM